MAANDIKQYFTYPGLELFSPDWIFVATWYNVTYPNGNDPQVSDRTVERFRFFQVSEEGVLVVPCLFATNYDWGLGSPVRVFQTARLDR
jgi:hypothetical protein